MSSYHKKYYMYISYI